ncbi:MAG: transposase [Patescibacteria group bacterium]
MRDIKISIGEHYHVFNRGVHKQTVFHDSGDYHRFLFLILYFQSPSNFPQVGRSVQEFVKHRVLDNEADIVKNRMVELVSFCIMPNHFHLILKEVEEGGISAYMQRVLNAYSKYYNTKYEKSGHVFQGPYRFVHIDNNEQLLHLSAYIHRNPRELSKWVNREDQYQWSSYFDLVSDNRWEGLLVFSIILEQFKSKEKYREFVKTSTAKVLNEELLYLENF